MLSDIGKNPTLLSLPCFSASSKDTYLWRQAHTHSQQTLLQRQVPCFPASPSQASWVEPPEVHQSPLHSLLLFILQTTPQPPLPPSDNPALSAPICQYYHQRDGLLCLGLVWTCNRSITLHYAAATRVKETERQRGGKGESDRGREQCDRREEGSSVPAEEGFTCPTEEGPPPPQPDPSGRRGGPCVAAKATGTMQLGLVALAMVFLSSMGHSDVLKLSKARRQRRGEFSLSQLVFYLLFFFLSSTAAFRFCGLSHSGDRPLNI